MRDDQRRRAGGDLEEPVEEVRLAARVQPGGRLVEYEDSRAVPDREQCARERDPLPLSTGQVDAALVAARQHRVPADLRGDAGATRARVEAVTVAPVAPAPPRRCSRAASADSARSPGRRSRPAAARRRIEPRKLGAVDQNPPADRIVHPSQQLDQCRLTGAVDPDQRRRPPRRQAQAQILEDGPLPDRDRRKRTCSNRTSRAGSPAGREGPVSSAPGAKRDARADSPLGAPAASTPARRRPTRCPRTVSSPRASAASPPASRARSRGDRRRSRDNRMRPRTRRAPHRQPKHGAVQPPQRGPRRAEARSP